MNQKIRARFVYEKNVDGYGNRAPIYGAWTPIEECIESELPMRPNPNYEVTRVDFQLIDEAGNEIIKKDRE